MGRFTHKSVSKLKDLGKNIKENECKKKINSHLSIDVRKADKDITI